MRMDATEQLAESSSGRTDANPLVSLADFREANRTIPATRESSPFLDFGNVRDLFQPGDNSYTGFGSTRSQDGFYRHPETNENLRELIRDILVDIFTHTDCHTGVDHPPITPDHPKPPTPVPPGGDHPGGPTPPGGDHPGGPPTPPDGSGNDILFGGYTNGSWRGTEARDALDRQIGGRAELEQFYRPMGGSISELRDYIQQDLDRGTLPEVSLSPKGKDFKYSEIISGEHDKYFHDLAKELGSMKDAHGNPAEILLRPGWEFNLRWMRSMGTSEQYVGAFQHMHDIFQQEGASNVKFVWSPGHRLDMSGLGRQPDLQHYWPGADYVDVIGPDGYSNTQNGHHESFDEIFRPSMDFAQRIGRSFMASETGIDRTGLTAQETADWWRSAYQTLQQRQARGLDVTGVAAFMKAGDFGWGHRDYTISPGLEQNTLRDTFLQ